MNKHIKTFLYLFLTMNPYEAIRVQYKIAYPWSIETINKYFTTEDAAQYFIENELGYIPGLHKPFGNITHGVYYKSHVLLINYKEKYYDIGGEVKVINIIDN